METTSPEAASSPPSERRDLYFEHAPAEVLGAILDQSQDCIKMLSPTGQLDFMNRNGRCVMEIDDFDTVAGRDWWDLWPDEARSVIVQAIERARSGKNFRFEAFCPTAKGSPRWWDVAVSPLRDGKGEISGIISISRDVTDRVNARELRETAAEEMRHRLQNAYTLTGAIISAAAKGCSDREQFASEILERLSRLGIVQSLLLDPGRFGTANVENLLIRLVEPFCTDGCDLRIGDLPAIELGEEEARALALAIGELSTNSNKYGALGHGGSIALDARVDAAGLRISWVERSAGPQPQAAREGGKGFRLIERALRASRGTIDIEWRSDGLAVAIFLPVAE